MGFTDVQKIYLSIIFLIIIVIAYAIQNKVSNYILELKREKRKLKNENLKLKNQIKQLKQLSDMNI